MLWSPKLSFFYCFWEKTLKQYLSTKSELCCLGNMYVYVSSAFSDKILAENPIKLI